MKEIIRNGNFSTFLEKLLRTSHKKLLILADESQKIIEIASEIADLCSLETLEVRQYLKCPSCLKQFHSKLAPPVILPCGHTLCKLCLKGLKGSSATSICPMDQKEFINIENLVPVNFSLMTATADPFATLCKEHNSTFLAYCIEDQRLLCGKCLLTHKTHTILPLDSENIEEVLKSKSVYIKKILELMRKTSENWEKFLEESLKSSKYLKKLAKKMNKKNQKIDEVQKLFLSGQEFLDNINHFVNDNNEEVLKNFRFLTQRLEWLLADFGDSSLCQRLLPKVLNLERFKSPQLFD